MSNNATRIEEIIQKRNIKQLVHFTRVENLKSIINNGILSRSELNKRSIKVKYNDDKRLDNWLNTSSFSVTERSNYLINRFNDRFNLKLNNWFNILIHTRILTEKECIFCDTNAASGKFGIYRENTNPLKLPEIFESLFNKTVQRTTGVTVRTQQNDNQTTCSQAEICIFGVIEKKYFLNLKKIENIIANG
jgi:hypothetical protein|tara:strand:+ start:76 stop:648 length:573 start_codon:yes stop_codon:yes gene_type:complete